MKSSWTVNLMREITKSIIKSVENEWIRNKWESTPYNVLGMQQSTPVFLLWILWGPASVNAHLSHPGLFFLNWFPLCINIFVVFFVTPCLVVTAQPCMEWIPIKKNSRGKLTTSPLSHLRWYSSTKISIFDNTGVLQSFS